MHRVWVSVGSPSAVGWCGSKTAAISYREALSVAWFMLKDRVLSMSQTSVGRMTAASSPRGFRMAMGCIRRSVSGRPSLAISFRPVKE